MIMRPTGRLEVVSPHCTVKKETLVSADNPYTSPITETRNVPATPGLQSLLFSFAGRIPRRAYWGRDGPYVSQLFVVSFLTMMIFGGESGLPAPPSDF